MNHFLFKPTAHHHLNIRSIFQPLLAILLITPLLISNKITVAAQTTGSGPIDLVETTAFIDGTVSASMENSHVPGAIVVIVKDGDVFFAKGYGYADLETLAPVDPARTLFRPGSISKLFTWTAVMQLVEQGKLSLDEDVNTYLDFKIPATFNDPITLKDLMTHTAGFEDKGQGLFKLDSMEVSSLEEYVKQNLPARVFPAGEISAYSNYGTALSGYIVERVSGIPFNEYIRKNIFEPLVMNNSTFQQPLPAKFQSDMASAYNYINGNYVKGSFEYVVGTPAGALSTTGLDMARFMIAHLQNGDLDGKRILQEKTAIQMHSPLYASDPRLDGMAYGFFESMTNGNYVISHGGDTMLFHSNLFLIPEYNLGLFISTNGSNGNQMVETVVKTFMDRYFPVPPPSLTPSPDFSDRAETYAGSYTMARSNFTTMEKILSLTSSINVTVAQNQEVSITLAGKTMKYIEVEPGLLVNVENPDDRLVLKENNRQVTLSPSMPFVFLKNPWYASGSLHLLIFAGGALLFLITIIFWVVTFFRRMKERVKPSLPERAFRFIAGLFGLTLIIFLLGLALTFTNVNPAFGVPEVYFGTTAALESLLTLPVIMLISGLFMLVFSVLAWIRNYWTPVTRVYYNLLTLVSILVLWAMVFWNLI